MAALGVIGTVATIAAAAASLASIGYQAAQGPPNLNTGNAQKAGALAQAEALPFQRAYEAAAMQGGQVLKQGFTQTTVGAGERAALQAQIDQINQTLPKAGTPQAELTVYQGMANQRAALQAQLQNIPEGGGTVYKDAQGNTVPASQAVENFAGLGEADVQGQLAKQMAQVKLDLQNKYGIAFTEEAKKQLELADPLGTQARQKLYDLISTTGQEPVSPVATQLDSEMAQQIQAGQKLDPVERAVLDDAVSKAQSARGQDAGADTQQFATPLETGFEGSQRALGREQQATSYLGSGSTPEDIAYRQEQQQMANLGAFVNGVTPEAQFRNLSGAQQGAAPFVPGQPLPQATGNPGQTSQAYATSGALANLRYQNSQANSWMAGLSSVISGIGALNNAAPAGS